MSCDTNIIGQSGFGDQFGSQGSGLSDLETELYGVIRSTLPPHFFLDDKCDEEIWLVLAKVMGLVRTRVIDTDTARTYILQATGIWLDLHAKDRGTRRQPGETDEQLRIRLRTYNNTVSPSALVRANNLGLRYFGGGSGSFAHTYSVVFTPQNVNATQQLVGTASITVQNALDTNHFVRLRWLGVGNGTYDVFRNDGHKLASLTNTYVYQDDGYNLSAGTPQTDVLSDPLGIVTQSLLSNGVILLPGYPALVELRKDKAFFHTPGSTPDHRGFFDIGRRFGNKYPTIIVILPPGSEPYVDIISQGIYQRKGAGINVKIEVAA